MAMATAIRPTPTATAIRPIITAATAATTGLTTAGTMAATMATGSRGGRHPSCLLAPRSTPRSPWPAQRFVASTAAHCLQARRRVLALIYLSGGLRYRGLPGAETHLGPGWGHHPCPGAA